MSNNLSAFGPEYPKINTVFNRDPKTRLIIPTEFAEEEFDYLQNNLWLWTEKIDGTNIRLHYNGEHVVIGGRTDNAQIPACLLGVLEPLTNVDRWKDMFGGDCESVTIHGEGYGPKILKGRHYTDKHEFIVFDVRVGRWWLKFNDVQDIARQFGLNAVPVAAACSLNEAIYHVQNDHWMSQISPTAKFEGVVGHPIIELHARNGGRITAKLKTEDFVKYNEAQLQVAA